MVRLLTNLNIIPNLSQNANTANSNTQNVQQSFVNPTRCSSNRGESFSLRTEKIPSIIQKLERKVGGSATGLTVEEFLYSVRTLTSEHFNGDFSIICKNVPILLSNKALNWYWRYH